MNHIQRAASTARDATTDDIPGIAGAMARAFDDDPMFEWLFPDRSQRTSKLDAWFARTMRAAWSTDRGRTLTTDAQAGVAVWLAPGKWKVPTRDVLKILPATLRIFGPRSFVRILKVLSEFEKRHPSEEHWYLEWLATDPPMQRRGVGAALMAPILERCDAEGLPAYLETQKPENVAYYRHHGFEVRDEMDIVEGGPRAWFMWREPRA